MGRPRVVSDREILGAVGAVLDEHGPAGLTLAAVGARLGVTAPAVRQRFGSKRALLVAFAAEQADAVPGAFATARMRTRDPLRAAVTGLVLLAGEPPDRTTIANNLAFLQLDVTDAELRGHAVAHARAVRAELAALVREAEGRAGRGDGAERVADMLLTTYNGALVGWALEGTGRLGPWLRRRLEQVLRRAVT